ncbi:hypothetical protein CIB48_g10312 [Xylaria polymorpha]|nr:hypothetical protein CIB48_g10312 [Xylaria polymorpha]
MDAIASYLTVHNPGKGKLDTRGNSPSPKTPIRWNKTCPILSYAITSECTDTLRDAMNTTTADNKQDMRAKQKEGEDRGSSSSQSYPHAVLRGQPAGGSF